MRTTAFAAFAVAMVLVPGACSAAASWSAPVHGALFDCHWIGNASLVIAGTRGVYFFSAVLDG